MRYVITFWAPPNWQRESSINPNFLVGIAALAFLLLGVAILAILNTNLENQIGKQLKLERALEEDETAVSEVRRQLACLRFWKHATTRLETFHKQRILWSRQLETLALTVPETMTLTMLSSRGTQQPLPARGESQRIIYFGLQYMVRFQGEVIGEDAGAIIRHFSQQFASVPGFKGVLEKVELREQVPLSNETIPGKQFRLRAWYRTIDWRGEGRP